MSRKSSLMRSEQKLKITFGFVLFGCCCFLFVRFLWGFLCLGFFAIVTTVLTLCMSKEIQELRVLESAPHVPFLILTGFGPRLSEGKV